MGVQGFFVPNEGHVMLPLFPKSITGGITGVRFDMADYSHASILIAFGATVAQPTAIIVKACTAATGGTATAIAVPTFYVCETADTDVLGPKTTLPAAGYQPPATSDIFYDIELDSAILPQGSQYVEVDITAPAGAQLACIFVILSGARYQEDQSPTVLT